MISRTNQNAARRLVARLFEVGCLVATSLCIGLLGLLLADVLYHGASRLSWKFLTSFPSRFPDRAGIKSALWGSVWLISLTALFAVPVGVGAAIYLEEYSRRGWWRRIVQTNISNLAGVPSIVYGLRGHARERLGRIRHEPSHVAATVDLFLDLHIERASFRVAGQLAHDGLHTAHDFGPPFQPISDGADRTRFALLVAVHQQVLSRQPGRLARHAASCPRR